LSAPQATSAFPVRIAAIDAGSNAIRFVVAEFWDAKNYTLLAQQRVPIRLGQSVFALGHLDQETTDAAATIFRLFRRGMDLLGVTHYRAVATSATREASNKEAFISHLKSESGIDLDPISGSEEARLVHIAVAQRVNLSKGRCILVDLGGGSVEVSLVNDSGVLRSESYEVGTVRLLEALKNAKKRHEVPSWVRTQLRPLSIPPPASFDGRTRFIATGGNIEVIAQLNGGIPDSAGVSRLSERHLSKLIRQFSSMTTEERQRKFNLRSDRADVILPAALIYRHLADLAQANWIIVPNIGLRDGILIDIIAGLSRPSAQ